MNQTEYPLILTTGRLRARMTKAQKKILAEAHHEHLIPMPTEPIQLKHLFGRIAPVVCEIGFGDGACLSTLAKAHQDWDFLGIDVYLPGIASALIRIKQADLHNVRLIHGDARIVWPQLLKKSLDRIHVLFSDPWPKVRCHKRRLIQTEQLALWVACLKPQGVLYIATDDKQYAEYIEQCVMQLTSVDCLDVGAHSFMLNTPERPVTKYEQRGHRLGHCVVEWCLKRRE